MFGLDDWENKLKLVICEDTRHYDFWRHDREVLCESCDLSFTDRGALQLNNFSNEESSIGDDVVDVFDVVITNSR
jgi:hypothetical protein